MSLYDVSPVLQCPNRCLSWFLMSSFLYYKGDSPVLTDAEFDEICKALLARWHEVTHAHKYLVTVEDLKAGSGYAIREYPLMVQHAAVQWAREGRGNFSPISKSSATPQQMGLF